MATEIEHKFLVKDDSWRKQVFRSQPISQGYLASNEQCSVRVRISGDKALLNVKSATLGTSRLEFEYEVPLKDAREILEKLCSKPLIEKTRHCVRYGGHVWEIDVFEGANEGLVVAEVELSRDKEHFAHPQWLGEEVTHERRYYNAALAEHPYGEWT